MDCQKCMEYLDEALDDRLDENMYSDFADHLEQCDDCRQEYEEMKALMAGIQHLPDQDVPEGFRERWMSDIAREAQARTKEGKLLRGIFGNRKLQILTAAAAALMIGVVGPSVFPRSPMSSQEDGMGVLDNGDTQVYERLAEEDSMGIAGLESPPAGDSGAGITGWESPPELFVDASESETGISKIEEYLESQSVQYEINEMEASVWISPDNLGRFLDWLEDNRYSFRRDRETLEREILENGTGGHVEIRMIIQK